MSECIDLKSEGINLTLRVSENTGWLHLCDEDGSVLLTQKNVKALLPYLQAYAETGKIKQVKSQEPLAKA